MSLVGDTVYYCCVSKGNRILYSYGGGEDRDDIEKLATLCLEKIPPFHKWYFHTSDKKTFGFLMDDGYVYFAIADEAIGKSGVGVFLQFLEHVRSEFKKVAKRTRNGSKGSLSGGNLSSTLCDELVPVIHRLISSLERVSHVDEVIAPLPSPECSMNGQSEVLTSTKAPLLGKPGKQEKKKMKDRAVEIRDTGGGVDDHRRSTDRGIKIDVPNLESNNQSPVSAISIHKGSSSMRVRASPQYTRRLWWRKVRIVLAIDAIVCMVLFGIWLGICHGFRCISE